MEITEERITYQVGNNEAWICICKNTPSGDGFYTCDKDGNEIEPTIESDWNSLYVCASCGRIINSRTFEVIGKNVNLPYSR